MNEPIAPSPVLVSPSAARIVRCAVMATTPAPSTPGFWGWLYSRGAPFANAVMGILTTPEAMRIIHNAIMGGVTAGALFHLGSMVLIGTAPVVANGLPAVLAAFVTATFVTWGQMLGKLADNTDTSGNPVPPLVTPTITSPPVDD